MRVRSAQASLLIHTGLVFALIHLDAVQQARQRPQPYHAISTKLVFHPEQRLRDGGGGGRESLSPKLGKPPATSPRPFVPPTTKPPDHEPALPLAPTVLGPPSIEAAPLAQLGSPTGIAGPPSDGPGRGPGIGRGTGRYGVGDGAGDGTVRGIPATTDTRPQLLFKVEPEFTDEARKARLQGVVVLWAEIDESGRASNVRVTRGLGLGLDERAIEAVGKWRFRPATRGGRPVRSQAFIEVSFRLL